MIHPLALALGPEWLWLSEPSRDVIVLLHNDSGVWTQMSMAALQSLAAMPLTVSQVAQALQAEADDGGDYDRPAPHGEHVIIITTNDLGTTWARVERA